MADEPQYPEHEKLHKVAERSQACGAFMEWLQEKRYVVGQYHEHTDECWLEGESHTARRRTCGAHDDVLYPSSINISKLLSEFFEIDEEKLEAEKLAMLAALRGCPSTIPGAVAGERFCCTLPNGHLGHHRNGTVGWATR